MRSILLFVVASLTGCTGIGVRDFTPLNSGPLTGRVGETPVYVVECRDTFGLSGNTTVYGAFDMLNQQAEKGVWYASCNFHGQPLPWRVLGVLHAGWSDMFDWPAKRDELARRAQRIGCPGVAVREHPPIIGEHADAVGAICINPNEPPTGPTVTNIQ